jgi:hypothetical protein
VSRLPSRRVCWPSNALALAGALAFAGASMSVAAAPPDAAIAPPDAISPPDTPTPPDNTAAPKMRDVRTLADALVVEPGATCLDRETMLEHIRSWRDQDQIDHRIAIRVRGSSDDPNSVNFVTWFADEVVIERSFDDAPNSCTDLHAVVGLAIAIALDDALPVELGIVELEPEPEPEPVEQVHAGEGDVPDFTDERPASTRRRGPALALTAAAGAFVGVTPRASFGGLLSFDMRPREHFDVRIGALATHLPGFELDAPGYDDGRVAVTVAAGRIDLCWGTTPRRVRARICGGVAGGAAISAGRGYTSDFRRSTPWFAGLVGADLGARIIGPLSLELRVEGVLPFQRTVLDVRSTSGQLLARERFAVAGLIVSVGPRIDF